MGQPTRRLSGLSSDLQGNVNPGYPFDVAADRTAHQKHGHNREVMARSGFMEADSSPLALQARGRETLTSSELAVYLLGATTLAIPSSIRPAG